MEAIEQRRCQIVVYVPESHLEPVKEALFSAGAGKIGDYDKACWQCIGQGQFRPNAGANPSIGEVGQLCFVQEYRIEMICPLNLVPDAIKKLKQAHPYEEPAYSVILMESYE